MASKKQIDDILNRLDKLEKAVFEKKKTTRAKTPGNDTRNNSPELDFTLNERAFVNRFVADQSGPARFTILLAYMVNGNVNNKIALAKIKKTWNNMSGKRHLGKFNMFYPNEAKNRGWADSPERGYYTLTKEWKQSYAK